MHTNLHTDQPRLNGAPEPMPKKTAPAEVKKLRMTIYLPEADVWAMRSKAVALRIKSDTAAVEDAVAQWIAGSVKKPDARLRSLIETVLGDSEERPGLEKYLAWAVDQVRKRKKSGG